MEDTRKKKKIKAEAGFIVVVLLIIVAVIEGTTYRKIIPANQPKVVVILPGDTNDQSWNKGNYEGILANQILALFLQQETLQLQRAAAENHGEFGVVTIKNTNKYPFSSNHAVMVLLDFA